LGNGHGRFAQPSDSKDLDKGDEEGMMREGYEEGMKRRG
jgi:hypothetical protein